MSTPIIDPDLSVMDAFAWDEGEGEGEGDGTRPDWFRSDTEFFQRTG